MSVGANSGRWGHHKPRLASPPQQAKTACRGPRIANQGTHICSFPLKPTEGFHPGDKDLSPGPRFEWATLHRLFQHAVVIPEVLFLDVAEALVKGLGFLVIVRGREGQAFGACLTGEVLRMTH
jgi:hypothetical protein